MTAAVTLIDYGLGNIKAFEHMYSGLNIDVNVASSARELESAKKLILPGVGAFDWAMTRLNSSGLRDVLDELVLNKAVPVLGVCVGMQMMAQRSEEGSLPGLGWIEADVVHLGSFVGSDLPLPHMGWNSTIVDPESPLFHGLQSPRYYFLHSYCIVPAHETDVLATSDYGCSFTAAVNKKHIYGTQFHPEKSHQWGICLLKNFSEL